MRKKTKTVVRDARTGRFVGKAEAKARPDTTVTEVVDASTAKKPR